VQLIAELPDPPQRLVADPDRLQQVIWNLLSNAVKFTPRGGRVRVDASQVGGSIQICVTDSGLGIAPEFLPFVFDRFRQADSTSTRSHGGLGIGLTIVRHIVELHGGTVRADSRGEGQGSTFTVTLPITAAVDANEDDGDFPPAPSNGDRLHAPVAPADSAPASAAAAATVGPLAGLRLLLVDDAPDALEVLAVILRRAKADVTTAGSALEARRFFQERPPDVLISDIAMPDEDGFALIRSVRMLPAERGGNVPAVALTAYAREDDRNRALAAGFQAHLAKPVEPDDLISTLRRLAGTNSPTPALEPVGKE
jgi:CheY-like chemotaxis protein/anti-sigma regulatory factor (Ser/Thr protein kinase)